MRRVSLVGPALALLLAAALVLTGCAGTSGSRSATPAPTSGGSVTTPEVPPTTARWVEGGTVWIANEEGRSLTSVDALSGSRLATYDTPGRPHNIAVSRSGVVAATLPGEGAIFLVRMGGRGRLVSLGGQPHDVKSVGARFVVANEEGRRLQLVDAEGRQSGEIPLPSPPHDVAVTADGRTAWVSLDGSDRLAVVDLEGGALRRLVPTGASPHDLLFAPGGDLWVTDWDGPVRVYSPQGDPKGRVALGQESHHLAFSPDGAEVWVTDNAARRVFVVDTARQAVVDVIETPGAPHHLAIRAGRAVVADGTGAAVVFDVASRRQVAVVPTGAGPHGAAAAAA